MIDIDAAIRAMRAAIATMNKLGYSYHADEGWKLKPSERSKWICTGCGATELKERAPPGYIPEGWQRLTELTALCPACVKQWLPREEESMDKKPMPNAEPDNTQVICPKCCHQFRAIPVQVQDLLLAAGYTPPFASRAWNAK